MKPSERNVIGDKIEKFYAGYFNPIVLGACMYNIKSAMVNVGLETYKMMSKENPMKILITNGTLKGLTYDVLYKDGDTYKIKVRGNIVTIYEQDCVVVV